MNPLNDNEVYKIIDTNKIYHILKSRSALNEEEYLNKKFKYRFASSYLKFYSDGRVGNFYEYDSNNVNSLNPKKASMGYYFYKNKKISLKIHFEHPQGGGFLNYELYSTNKDTLKLKLDEGTLILYKIIDIPKEFLIYKPDW